MARSRERLGTRLFLSLGGLVLAGLGLLGVGLALRLLREAVPWGAPLLLPAAPPSSALVALAGVGLMGSALFLLLRRRGGLLGLLSALLLSLLASIALAPGFRFPGPEWRPLPAERPLGAPSPPTPGRLPGRVPEDLAPLRERLEGLLPEDVPRFLEGLTLGEREGLARLLSGEGARDLDPSLVGALQEGLSRPQSVDPEGLAGALLESGVTLGPEGLTPLPSVAPEGAHALPKTPLFRVEGARGIRYLRTTAVDTYRDGVWLREAPSPSVPLSSSPKGGSPLTITPVAGPLAGTLPAPAGVVAGEGPVPLRLRPEEGLVEAQGRVDGPYTLWVRPPSLDPQALAQAPAGSDRRYLQLPPDFPERVRRLAEEVTAGIPSAYGKALALARFLRENYTYDLAYRNAPPGVEPAEWFLFEERRGVCANFSHAFVVMARSIGLPARPVAGWAIAPVDEPQVVRADQAHQWAEVLLEGVGWVPVDPTPFAPGPLGRALASVLEAEGATLATDTRITRQPERAVRGESLTVEGEVFLEDGRPLPLGWVEVYLNREKRPGGTLIGGGEVVEGRFSVLARLPNDLDPGPYQVLAHTLDGPGHRGSWSDPGLVVQAPTRLTLALPDRAAVGRPLEVRGRLEVADTGEPLAGREVRVEAGGRAFSVRTDEEGGFRLSLTPRQAGPLVVVARFEGTETLAPASAQGVVPVGLPGVLEVRLPDRVFQGETLTATGRLVDGRGRGLQGVPVRLQVDGEPVQEVPTRPDGSFSLSWRADTAPGPLTVTVAVDPGSGVFAQPVTRTVTVQGSARLLPDPPPQAVAGHLLLLRGRVVDGQGRPLTRGTVWAEGAPPAPVEDGRFEAVLRVPPVRDRLSLTLNYKGPEGVSPASALLEVEVAMPTRLDLTAPERVPRGEPFLLRGRLVDAQDNPLGGQEVQVRLLGPEGREAEGARLRTDASGAFTLPLSLPGPGTWVVEALYEGVPPYLPARSGRAVEALPVVLTLDPPFRNPDGSLTLRGTVSIGGEPAEGVEAVLWAGGTPLATARTDGAGRFNLTLTPEVRPRRAAVRLPRYGVEAVWDLSPPPPILPLWLGALTALVAGGIGLVGGWALARRRPLAPLRPPPLRPAWPRSLHRGLPRLRRGPRLTLHLPGLEEGLPPVWGIGEPLPLSLHLVDERGTPLPGAPVEVEAGSRVYRLTTDADGRASLTLPPAGPGPLSIRARWRDGANRRAEAEIALRVVDYREEVVALFRRLREWAWGQGLFLPPEATPREVLRRVVGTLRVDTSALHTLVWAFEEAEYSHHPADRSLFVSAWRAFRSLTQGPGEGRR